ncbi:MULTISPECIES: porin OmpC [Enterobacterales]|jgi:outer membrane pore protein C|uniref:Outer membrane pore protein C n=1 Tax=Candidatus Pantoea symbiotica TaxID=1884370 RepID=A0A1I3WN22_9GAMM|nr:MULTISPECIES: porin OmpC [Enterobacterales]MDY0926172.1 porin OmpC [Enterobacter sp. CFBP8995]MRT23082.1 porin OmpC [Enterobacteriaceae bacterium RIT697]MRT42080.1 porin OmpC [Enterobacteriaceae bacterium RIT702]KAJ9432418.1 porin OmpC [Pantoea sp. YR343]MBB3304274.1 outer membrane pore protein C [Enterobacter sp. Sphag1F]
MKRRVLSLMIPALLVAGSASAAEIYNKDGNKLDLYGKVDGLHYFSDNSSSDGDQSYLRFGFKGETQVTDQLTGYGQWEYQAALNTAESEGTANSFTRVGFAGLKFGDAGSFDYGRNYGVMYDLGAWTDVLPEFGGDTYGADNFLFQRSNGLATYRNTNFFGLVDGWNFAVQYQGKNDNPTESTGSGRDVLGENGDGYGLSTTYDLGSGFGIGAAMFQSDRTNNQNGNNPRTANILGRGDKAEAYSGALKYDANNVYLAAMYSRSYNATRFGASDSGTVYGYANKADNWELVAQYQFDFGLRPSLAFVSSRGTDIEGYGSQNLKKYIDVGATYYFNKNMSTYVDYQINLLDDNNFTDAAGINTDDVVALGLVYQF